MAIESTQSSPASPEAEYNSDGSINHDPALGQEFRAILGNAGITDGEIRPLAEAYQLYVATKPWDPDDPKSRKTTYSTQSEANAD